jgi:hypothetical protein
MPRQTETLRQSADKKCHAFGFAELAFRITPWRGPDHAQCVAGVSGHVLQTQRFGQNLPKTATQQKTGPKSRFFCCVKVNKT